MKTSNLRAFSILTLALGVTCAAPVSAQDVATTDSSAEPPADPLGDGSGPSDDAGDAPPITDGGDTGTSGSAPTRRADPGTDTADVTQSGIISDEQTITEQTYGVEPVRRGTDPYEDPNEKYFFLGGFYHHHWVPSSIVELFVQSSPATNNPQFGAEFTIRRDGLDVIIGAWYADFTFSGPFLANGDPITDTEIIDSDTRVAFLGTTLLWTHMFNDYIGIQGGLSLGVGYVFGDLERTEAYPSEAGGWRGCESPTAGGQPGSVQYLEDQMMYDTLDASRASGNTINDFCQPATDHAMSGNPPITNQDGERGAHYGVTIRKWFDGGSGPNFWFRIAPQMSIRFKPIHQLVFRIDGGFDFFSGAYVGGALSIGLN